MYLLIVVSLFLNVLATVEAGTYSPAISTTSGVIQGKLIHVSTPRAGLDVYEFLGVPYAEAPVGELRFAKTVPKNTKQSTLLIATKSPSACPQAMGLPIFNEKYAEMMVPNEQYSEDCLYINAWVPRQVLDKMYANNELNGPIVAGSTVFSNSSAPLAVMVWFHGGGFSSGSNQAPVYNASALAAYNNVIVISVQYRLGILGFGYLEGSEDLMKGNMGLWDQLEALNWVRRNVAGFGGNPDKVTIFGESAGAASVGFHLLSQRSQPYFNRAILQSGSPTSATWSYLTKEEANERTSELVNTIIGQFCAESGVNLESSFDEKFACLRAIEAEEFVKLQDTVLKFDITKSYGLPYGTFLPVTDGDFIAQNPSDLLKQKKIPYNKAVLLGSNKEETALMMLTSSKARLTFPTPLDQLKSMEKLNGTDFLNFIREYFAFYPRNHQEATDMMRRFIEMQYMCDRNKFKGAGVLAALVEATSDFAVNCPLIELADAEAQANNSVYVYSFSHRIEMQFWPTWMGATQTDELPFVMGFPFTAAGHNGFKFSPAERLLSRQMMTYWTNFAKFGNVSVIDIGSPNSMMLTLPKWPSYNLTDKIGYAIYADGMRPSSVPEAKIYKYKEHECVFWNELYPTMVDLLRKSPPAQTIKSAFAQVPKESTTTRKTRTRKQS